jgi:hypothetical protein
LLLRNFPKRELLENAVLSTTFDYLPHFLHLPVCQNLATPLRVEEWTKVGEDLVRRHGGKLYLRAKIGSKCVRLSLKRSALRVALIRRNAKLDG